MATFHGFKVTNLRSWEGMEGLATSGTLYWNGKKLGNFADYGDGGCVSYRFPLSRDLSKLVAEQLPNLCAEVYGDDATWMTPSLDTLVLALCDLAETEKVLRSAFGRAKRQGKVLVTAKEGRTAYQTFAIGASVPDKDILDAVRQAAPGCDEYRVWRTAPVLSEGDGERVRDDALCGRILAVEKDARARLAQSA